MSQVKQGSLVKPCPAFLDLTNMALPDWSTVKPAVPDSNLGFFRMSQKISELIIIVWVTLKSRVLQLAQVFFSVVRQKVHGTRRQEARDIWSFGILFSRIVAFWTWPKDKNRFLVEHFLPPLIWSSGSSSEKAWDCDE